MPFVSENQRKFFLHCRDNPDDPKCPPPAVIREFFKTEKMAEGMKAKARRSVASEAGRSEGEES
jgi:hypothetical protein